MNNFKYVTEKEARDIFSKDIKENKDSAVFVFTCSDELSDDNESVIKVAFANKLKKALMFHLSNRVTCPIYIIGGITELDFDEEYDPELDSLFSKLDITYNNIPIVFLYKNGNLNMRFETSYPECDLRSLIENIKKL